MAGSMLIRSCRGPQHEGFMVSSYIKITALTVELGMGGLGRWSLCSHFSVRVCFNILPFSVRVCFHSFSQSKAWTLPRPALREAVGLSFWGCFLRQKLASS